MWGNPTTCIVAGFGPHDPLRSLRGRPVAGSSTSHLTDPQEFVILHLVGP